MQTRRVGSVLYDSETDTFSIQRPIDEYWWPRDECLNAESLMGWICHLRRKAWFTPQMLSDFLDCLDATVREERGVRSLQSYFCVDGSMVPRHRVTA